MVREESLTLFGFADADERDVFEALQTVSGIGPRLALAMLAVHTPDGLRARGRRRGPRRARSGSRGSGARAPSGCVLELGDRLGPPAAPGSGGRSASVPSPVAASGGHAQVVEALVGLGWNARQAEEAVAEVTADGAAHGVAAADDVPAVLRAALRRLGRG